MQLALLEFLIVVPLLSVRLQLLLVSVRSRLCVLSEVGLFFLKLGVRGRLWLRLAVLRLLPRHASVLSLSVSHISDVHRVHVVALMVLPLDSCLLCSTSRSPILLAQP